MIEGGANQAQQNRAAIYLRMSTEHQKYSLENQEVAIRNYADQHNISIVSKYIDSAKSGVSIERRNGLIQLLLDAQSRQRDFNTILVLDISRWGRFQDVDESAYYEFICRKSGINVHYTAESFSNEATPLTAILKAIKRSMAGEYSRDLSLKVSAGKRRLSEKGYRQGGRAGFGFRRAVVDQKGHIKYTLQKFERKSLQTDRIILVPGPQAEITVVNRIYKYFVEEDYTQAQIVRILRDKDITNELGLPWSKRTIGSLLTNEKYVGTLVFNRRQERLGNKINYPPHLWQRIPNAFKPIVPQKLFDRAQRKIARQNSPLSNDEMLTLLKKLTLHKQIITAEVINSSPDMPPSSTYCSRFGKLTNAYRLIGYKPPKTYRHSEIRAHIEELSNIAVSSFTEKMEAEELLVQEISSRWHLFRLNNCLTVAVMIFFHRPNPHTGKGCWMRPSKVCRYSDYILAICLDKENRIFENYYLIPSSGIKTRFIQLPRMKTYKLEQHRYQSLDDLFGAVLSAISSAEELSRTDLSA